MKHSNFLFLASLTYACITRHTESFALGNGLSRKHHGPLFLQCQNNEDTQCNPSRRDVFANVMRLSVISIIGGGSKSSFAATATVNKGPTSDELGRIKIGYDQIQYLLTNFDKETTVCKVRLHQSRSC